MTPLKELVFSTHGDWWKWVKETGKGSWTKKGRYQRVGWGEMISTDCIRPFPSSMLQMVTGAFKFSVLFSPLFHSFFRHRRVGIEGLKHVSLAQFQWCYLLGGTVARWGKEFRVCEGRLQAISCASHLSFTHLHLFQSCPQPPQMDLSLQLRCSVVVSV